MKCLTSITENLINLGLYRRPHSEVVASVLKVVENFLKNGTDNQIQVILYSRFLLIS